MSKAELQGVVAEKKFVTSDLCWIKFFPLKPIFFQPGQFLSVLVAEKNQHMIWRCYSFAGPVDRQKDEGCELFVRLVEGGQARDFFDQLKTGDQITLRAPFGHFKYRPVHDRPVVFISTGTGLAPIRSIIKSHAFQSVNRPFALAVLGFRARAEIPFENEFDSLGVETRYAISRENIAEYGKKASAHHFFQGRVTDFLKQMSAQFQWQQCDYYICGNEDMIQEVNAFLASKQVASSQIFYEAFHLSHTEVVRKDVA